MSFEIISTPDFVRSAQPPSCTIRRGRILLKYKCPLVWCEPHKDRPFCPCGGGQDNTPSERGGGVRLLESFPSREELMAIQRGIEDIKAGRTFKMGKGESLDDFLNRIESECNV